jgi:hypothetical protein
MCPRISPVLIEPESFPDSFILPRFPRQNRRPLLRNSALAAFQGRGRRERRIKSNETLVEAGLADLSRENTPIGRGIAFELLDRDGGGFAF